MSPTKEEWREWLKQFQARDPEVKARARGMARYEYLLILLDDGYSPIEASIMVLRWFP